MTPNLFVATQTLFQPHRWFRQSKSERSSRKTEEWEEPVPGVYEYIPARGWYLIATKGSPTADVEVRPSEGGPVGAVQPPSTKETIKMNPPIAVKYSKVIKKYLLAPDYAARKKSGTIKDARGKTTQVGFFRLDDGVAWVNCWDAEGEFIPGPYKLWCIDVHTDLFRHMIRRDDPEYQRSQANSLANSRQNSFDRGTPADPVASGSSSRRRSQESRSTEFRAGPNSTRDGPSLPSTRANSIRNLTPSNPASRAPSQPVSRRGSLTRGQRSPRIPLDEAKAALSAVAREREQAAKAKEGGGSSERKSSPTAAAAASLTVE